MRGENPKSPRRRAWDHGKAPTAKGFPGFVGFCFFLVLALVLPGFVFCFFLFWCFVFAKWKDPTTWDFIGFIGCSTVFDGLLGFFELMFFF